MVVKKEIKVQTYADYDQMIESIERARTDLDIYIQNNLRELREGISRAFPNGLQEAIEGSVEVTDDAEASG